MRPALAAILFGGQRPVALLDFQTGRFQIGASSGSSFLDLPGATFTRASAKTAVDSQGNVISFASGVPAITDLGLLLEEARTNSFLNSATGVTQAVTTTAASWTLSFYGTGSITLTGGATGTLAGTGASNRVSLTVTATAASTTLTVSGSCTSVQFEAGGFVTSYIATAGTAVTRAQDVANISGISIPTGTMVASAVFPALGSTRQTYAELDDGTSANFINLQVNVAANFLSAVTTASSGVLSGAFNPPAPTANVTVGMAIAWASADFATSVGGQTAQTASSGTPPVTSILRLGDTVAGTRTLNGYLKRLTLYPSRLPNAQLQALTQ